MRRISIMVTAWILSCASVQAQPARIDYEARVPLPVTIEITPPATAVPAALAAFHGAWSGVWSDEWRHMLLVTKIQADGTAEVIYSVADNSAFQVSGSWSRHAAQIRDGILVVKLPHALITYRLDRGGALEANYVGGGGRHTPGYLTRHAGAIGGPHVALGADPLEGVRVAIPHAGLPKRADGTPGMLEARYYEPTGTAPLAILNHGSGIGRQMNISAAMASHARWLRASGYAVLVPMRRGRGLSDGIVGEDVYSHDASGQVTSIGTGVGEAIADLDVAIAFGRTLTSVKPGPVLLLGHSRGGFLSVVYAGRKPADVAAVINFVGGWMGGTPANENLNTSYFADAGRGAGAKVPHLWLYGDKDSFYGEAHIRANHQAFEAAGGKAQFEFYKTVPGNGHWIGAFPDRWRATADTFLATLRAP